MWGFFVMFCKRALFFVIFFLSGCKSFVIPNEFVYKEIQTTTFRLASWQKITNPNGKFKVYIEGDGASFDAYGRATDNPTPRGTLLREIAFGDNSPNVIYLARPCQFVDDDMCRQRHWTVARFAPEVINASFEAVKNCVGENEVVLVGFSGGAQVAGLISVAKKGLNVKRLISIGGNLDHLAWTEYYKLPSLVESLNLADYRDEYLSISQINYVGEDDDVVAPEIIFKFLDDDELVKVIKGATHNSGFEYIYPLIWME